MPPAGSLTRVVVVDDEQAVADSLAVILQNHGVDVIVCYHPEQAITAGRMLQPHVLISDVVMPGMNGFELARRYAVLYPACKVLLLSGNAQSQVLAREEEPFVPAPIFLLKPVHPAVILAFVDSCSSPN